MTDQYSCTVRLKNNLRIPIVDVQFGHSWTGTPGQFISQMLGTIDAGALSFKKVRIVSGTDGYDYWSVQFTAGEYSYSVIQKRCSLNSLDADANLIFTIEYRGENSNPKLLMTMNSPSCSEVFSKTKNANPDN